jgi:hypothetical protein
LMMLSRLTLPRTAQAMFWPALTGIIVTMRRSLNGSKAGWKPMICHAKTATSVPIQIMCPMPRCSAMPMNPLPPIRTGRWRALQPLKVGPYWIGVILSLSEDLFKVG